MIHMTLTHPGVLPGFGWGWEAVCSCGWRSAPAQDQNGARALGDIHLAENNAVSEPRS